MPDALLLRARCALAGDRAGEAKDFLETLLREHDGSSVAGEARGVLGEVLYRQGDFEGACRAFGAITTSDWDSAERDRVDLLWSLSEAAQGLNRSAAVRLSLLRARSSAGAYSARAAVVEAQCLCRLGEADAAMKLFELALRSGDKSLALDSKVGIARLDRASGKLEEAGTLLDEVIREQGESVDAGTVVERARVHLDAGEFDQALARLESLTTKSKGGDQARAGGEIEYLTARCEMRLNKFELAGARLTRLLDGSISADLRPSVMFDLGWSLDRAGEDARAAKAFQEFRARFPDHELVSESVAVEASIAHRAGRFEECVKLCNEFGARWPGHVRAAWVCLLRADSEYLLKQFDSAAEGYRRFLERWPKDEPLAAREGPVRAFAHWVGKARGSGAAA